MSWAVKDWSCGSPVRLMIVTLLWDDLCNPDNNLDVDKFTCMLTISWYGAPWCCGVLSVHYCTDTESSLHNTYKYLLATASLTHKAWLWLVERLWRHNRMFQAGALDNPRWGGEDWRLQFCEIWTCPDPVACTQLIVRVLKKQYFEIWWWTNLSILHRTTFSRDFISLF